MRSVPNNAVLMRDVIHYRWLLPLLMALLCLSGLEVRQAEACPNCKTLLSEDAAARAGMDTGDPDAQQQAESGLAKGFYWSILLMMPIPYLLTAAVGFGIWYHIRKNRSAVAAMQQQMSGGSTSA